MPTESNAHAELPNEATRQKVLKYQQSYAIMFRIASAFADTIRTLLRKES